MSNKTQLQENNTNLDGLVDRVNMAREAASNLPEAGGSINVTAQVGQTIVIEEVDASGKPTKWKAADFQERTHWSEYACILPETTVEIAPYAGCGTIPAEFTLEVGKEYTVKYNGAEYVRECASPLEGTLALGNYTMLDNDNPTDNGDPFVIAYAQIDEDVSGNVTFAWVVAPFDGSTSVTLSITGESVHTIPQKYIDIDCVIKQEVLEHSTFNASYDNDFGCYYRSFDNGISLIAGKEYTVTFDGVEYTHIAKESSLSGIYGVYIGNGLVAGLEDTGEPFVFVSAYGMMAGVAFLGHDNNSHTVRITTTKIDDKYSENGSIFYVDITGTGTDSDPYVCNESAGKVKEMYMRGREVKVRVFDDFSGLTVGYIYSLRLTRNDFPWLFSLNYLGNDNHLILLYPREDGGLDVADNLD